MTFLQDLKFGLRLVVKAPGASLIAMLALGLGIGANTAIFSVANAMLLHPLPYQHLDRLLDLAEVPPHRPPSATNSVSPFNFNTWRTQAHSFQAVAAYRYYQENLSGSGTPVMVQGAEVTANFFQLLPSRPLLGRTFLPSEDQPGQDREVILSQALWQHQFGADPGVIGRTVQLDQQTYTVVGVMGRDAVMPQAAALWMPLALTSGQLQTRNSHFLRVIGELRPGVSLAGASAELSGIAARVDAAYPDTNRDWGVHVQTLAQRTIGRETASYVLLLQGAVGFLLLIACANVANLQFARALGRNHELSLRVALGAGRARLMRQMLTENILLGLGGALVGIGFAAVSLRLILSYMPANVAQFVGGWDRIRLDGTALLFTLAVALVAGVLAGLAPAWHAARPELNATLKEGGRGAIGQSRRRLRAALVVAQITLAMVLLVGAGLMVQGFNRQLATGADFAPQSLLTAATNLPNSPRYDSPHARWAFYQQSLEKLAALPGVTSAASISELPLQGGYDTSVFSISGQPVADASQFRSAVMQSVSANLFAQLHIPLLSGRAFSPSDGPDSPPVAIVSQALARRYWPGRSPLGEHLKLGADASSSPWMTVVGVVGDVNWWWGDTDPEYTLYMPLAQQPSYSQYFLVRGAGTGDVTQLGPGMRQAIMAVDNTQPLFNIMSLAESIHEASIGIAYVSVMLTVAGIIALLLAAIGVYGVMAFLVSERVHEFGIRRALGASHGAILGLVFGRGAVMLAWGLVLGLPSAYFMARALQGLITGISAGDLVTYAAISLLLAAMAAAACFVPAHHAARVDPLVALREP
jgi:putative ABC transport system permease protein